MPITEDDFRDLLAERSASAPPAPDRLAAVRHRITRRQHRVRAAAAGAAALAVVAVAVGVPLAVGGGSAPRVARPAPASTGPTPGTTNPAPPLYRSGGRLLAGTTLHSPRQGSVTLRFIPTSLHLTVWTEQSGGWPDHGSTAVVTVNGHVLMWGGSGGATGAGGSLPDDTTFWSGLGVRVGRPATVTVTVVRGQPAPGSGGRPPVVPPPAPRAQRPTGTVSVGVYQRVPLADYPFPSPPATLATPDPVYGTPVTKVSARTVGTTGRWTRSVRLRKGLTLSTTAVAPGEVRVLVDGHPVMDFESWDYRPATSEVDLVPDRLREYGVHVGDGQRVTLTVVARRFTRPGWAVSVVDRS